MKRDKRNLSLKTQLIRIKDFIEEAGINAEKRQEYLCRPDQDFTRRRKLDFSTTVVFILGLLKKV